MAGAEKNFKAEPTEWWIIIEFLVRSPEYLGFSTKSGPLGSTFRAGPQQGYWLYPVRAQRSRPSRAWQLLSAEPRPALNVPFTVQAGGLAERHSEEMARSRKMSHHGFSERAQRAESRFGLVWTTQLSGRRQ
jgi:hypothetical protein